MKSKVIDFVIGWGVILSAFVLLPAFILGMIYVRVESKLEICRTYYPEISKTSCFVSHYGIPPRAQR